MNATKKLAIFIKEKGISIQEQMEQIQKPVKRSRGR